jgi:hypothetical protein
MLREAAATYEHGVRAKTRGHGGRQGTLRAPGRKLGESLARSGRDCEAGHVACRNAQLFAHGRAEQHGRGAPAARKDAIKDRLGGCRALPVRPLWIPLLVPS